MGWNEFVTSFVEQQRLQWHFCQWDLSGVCVGSCARPGGVPRSWRWGKGSLVCVCSHGAAFQARIILYRQHPHNTAGTSKSAQSIFHSFMALLHVSTTRSIYRKSVGAAHCSRAGRGPPEEGVGAATANCDIWVAGCHWVLCAVLGAAPMWVHGLGCSWLESFPAAPNALLSGFSSSPCFRTFCGMLFIAATTTSFNLEFYYSQRRLLKAAAPLSPLAQPHELIVSNHPRSKMSLLSSPLENATSCSYFLLNEKGKMKS